MTLFLRLSLRALPFSAYTVALHAEEAKYAELEDRFGLCEVEVERLTASVQALSSQVGGKRTDCSGFAAEMGASRQKPTKLQNPAALFAAKLEEKIQGLEEKL